MIPTTNDLIEAAKDPRLAYQPKWVHTLVHDLAYRLKQEARAAEAAQEAAGPEWVWRATIVVEPYLYWCPEHRPAVAVAKTVLADVHPSVTIECVQCGRRIRKGEG